MLFVLDTNILISATLKPSSMPANAVAHAIQRGKLIFSTETENELREVIARDKFNKYIPALQRLNSVDQLIIQSEGKHVSIQLAGVCQDVRDVKFLNLALEYKADCIVSGDHHLLMLHPFRGIPILSPADFLKLF